MKQDSSQAVAIGRGTGKAAQRGASLIEVLVILVVLLVGLGTIIRIFPIGLATLRTTETRTLAVQLANQQAEQLKADAQNLPQGILLAYFDSTGKRVFDATQDSDSLTPYKPGTNGNATVNPYYTDVNKYRFIDGEVVKVAPPVITDDFGAASIYLVKFGPAFMSAAAGSSTTSIDPNAGDYLRVYSAPLQEINAPYVGDTSGDNSGRVRNFLRGAQSFLLDTDSSEDEDGTGVAHILLPPTTNKKIYLVSYSYDAGSGVYRSVDKQMGAYGLGTGTNGNQWETIVTPAGKAVLPGSVRVYRLFDRVTSVLGTPGTINWDPAAPNDPYQYALLSENIKNSSNVSTFANIGRIAFNPSGASYGQRSANGQQAFTAYVDYSVLDWHILREDREVPSGVPGSNFDVSIRTTLGNWKRAGDPNPDNTIYDGMFGAGTNDLVVIDLQTGRELKSDDYSNASTTSDADFWINNDQTGSYRSGTLYINTRENKVRPVPRGSQIRILYKAEGDWGISVQKAYSRYQAVASAYPATDSPSSFTTGDAPDGSSLVYFNRSEYNKSFVVQFQYTMADKNFPSDPTKDRIVQTAPQQVALAGTDGTPFVTQGGFDFSFAQINGLPDNNGISDGLMPYRRVNKPWSVVSNVAYGVSIKTRVVYRDANSGRGAGDADPSSGWRVQDVDTYLTRAF